MHKKHIKNLCKQTKFKIFAKALAYCECMRYNVDNGKAARQSRNTPPCTVKVAETVKDGCHATNEHNRPTL